MKWLVRILVALLVLAGVAFYALFLSERPSLGTDPATLAGDAPLDAMFTEFSAGDGASAQEAADKDDDEYEAFLQGNGAPCHCLLYSPAGLAFDPGGSRTGVLQR